MRKYLGKKIKIEDAIKEGNILYNFCSAIPNYLGINLCSVKEFEITSSDEDVQQLHTLKIKFKEHKMTDEEKEAAKLNGACDWVEKGTQDWEFWMSN